MFKSNAMSENSILFLVNNKAGNGLPKKFEARLNSFLNAQNIKYKIAYSEYAGHLRELAKEGIEAGFKSIVVAGGDGSINEVFVPLVNTNIRFGILPFGSGNGLARHLKIPLNLEQALQIIVSGKAKLIDSATINEIPFLSIAGTGFDAFIAKQFPMSKSRGFRTYFKMVLKYYFGYQSIHYKIPSESYQTDALLISFANSSQFGNNISIAPQASIDDGLIDVCIVQKPPLFALPFMILMLLTGKINKSKYYQSFKSKQLTVECHVNQLINIDGEFKETSNQITVKVVPGSINIIVP